MATIKSRKLMSHECDTPLINDAYSAFLTSRKVSCSKSTVKIYMEWEPRFKSWFSDSGITRVGEISVACLRDLLTEYGKEHTSGGVHFAYRHLKAFVNWCWEEYSIPTENPMKKVQVKKASAPPKTGISRDEINAILTAIKDNSKFPERDTAIVMVLADTGIRKSSMCSIQMKDLNLKENNVTVFEKDQQFHIKSFGVITGRALRRYLSCLEDVKPTDPLWLNVDGSVMTNVSMEQMLLRMCKQAGIGRHLFHDFRRFYGLELYKETKDIYFVSRMLDHKDVEVTKRYLAINNLEDAEAARRVSPMDNGRITGVSILRR